MRIVAEIPGFDALVEKTVISNAKSKLLKRRIITTEDCWLWKGCAHANGYATVRFKSETWSVHRLSMFLFKPDEFNPHLDVLHTCDVSRCFNPAHLYSGTQVDNMQDRIKSGNNPELNKTSCIRGHDFTPENTYINKLGHRSCKICRKNRDTIRHIMDSIK
jgi:hypothetical protein